MFFDFHCHILYGVDDGPASPSGMFEMVKSAYFCGIRKIIVTPHCNPQLFGFSPERLNEAYAELTEYCKSKFPDLEIYKGAELFAYTRFPGPISENLPVFIADGKKVLTEFLPDSDFRFVSELVTTLISAGITPVIAHIERYRLLSKNNVIALKKLGAVITLNASFFCKTGFFRRAKFLRLINDGIIDMVASDAHRPEDYGIYSDCYDFLVKKSGRQKADQLFYMNAARLFGDPS